MADRPTPKHSFVLETNQGGIPATVCACGVLLLTSDLAWKHIDSCPAYQETTKGG